MFLSLVRKGGEFMRIEAVDKRLLSYLQQELENKKIRYKTQPTPLEGGFESLMYTFQLENAPKAYSNKQVLRIYPSSAKNTCALREGIVQNYLHNQGFPTPSVPFICTDPEPISAPFARISRYLIWLNAMYQYWPH